MKLIISLLFIFTSLAAFSKPEAICSAWYARQLKNKIYLNQNEVDKFRHCALSCQLALRCHANDVLLLGFLKEISDEYTGGDPDFHDLIANTMGVSFVLSSKAKTDDDCVKLCDKQYPANYCNPEPFFF